VPWFHFFLYIGTHADSAEEATDWDDTDYIFASNHFICDFSYDRDNSRTDVPMTTFSDGNIRDPKTGEISGLNGRKSRAVLDPGKSE
jgi:hypothetical protein